MNQDFLNASAGCSKRRPYHPPNPGAPRRALSQARPQRAKRRCVHCSVRGASERSEHVAGGLFQHPARLITGFSLSLCQPASEIFDGGSQPYEPVHVSSVYKLLYVRQLEARHVSWWRNRITLMARGEGDSEAVYLVHGSVLSLSFVEPNKPDRPDRPDPRHAPRSCSRHLFFS